MGEPYVRLDPCKVINICATCRTHVAVYSERIGLYDLSRIGLKGSTASDDLASIFRNVVNVYSASGTRKAGTKKAGRYTMQKIHCRRCCDDIGWKIVQVLAAANQSELVQPGDFLIEVDKVLLAAGQYVAANDEEQVGLQGEQATDGTAAGQHVMDDLRHHDGNVEQHEEQGEADKQMAGQDQELAGQQGEQAAGQLQEQAREQQREQVIDFADADFFNGLLDFLDDDD